MSTLLIVDDDAETVRFMEELLAEPGRQILSAGTPDRALALVREHEVDVVVSDINLNADRSGLDLLRAVRSGGHPARVVLISGFGTLETAIDAVRHGAFDYISKPFDIAEVKATVERALTASEPPPEAPTPIEAPPGLIGRSPAMLAVYKQIAHAADAQAPVLIVGDSGTGKELVARAIHRHGRRAARPFVPINCGALTETLLESELFGHTRGAFTGAVNDARGLFEQAQGGTIFLDEIGETSPALQVKLLRVLQEGEVRPVGASRTVKVDVRVVAATNVDLEEAVAAGRFRQDLYYRLSVLVIRVPALRGRRDDIPLLVERFLQNACGRAGRTMTIAPGALERWSATTGPATSASSRTPSSGWCSPHPATSSPPTTCVSAPRRRKPERQAAGSRAGCSRACRRSTSWSAATCCTCSMRSAATARAPPKRSASIGARSTGWRSASGCRCRSPAAAAMPTRSVSPDHDRRRGTAAGGFGVAHLRRRSAPPAQVLQRRHPRTAVDGRRVADHEGLAASRCLDRQQVSHGIEALDGACR